MIGEETMLQRQLMAESIKYGLIIVASAPIIAIYPLIQKALLLRESWLIYKRINSLN